MAGQAAARIDGPLGAVAGLDELAPLWQELHEHHRQVAAYGPLVEDAAGSWLLRRRWYEQVLADGGRYFVARDSREHAIGYSLIAVTPGADDTFLVHRGVVEIITLVVSSSVRGRGLGHQLMAAIESFTREQGWDVIKVAVMTGNRRAEGFYASHGFSDGEHVLYRPVDPRRC